MAQIYRMVGSFETLTVYHSAMLGVKIEGHFIPHTVSETERERYGPGDTTRARACGLIHM